MFIWTDTPLYEPAHTCSFILFLIFFHALQPYYWLQDSLQQPNDNTLTDIKVATAIKAREEAT